MKKISADEQLRQLGWVPITGWQDYARLWYAFPAQFLKLSELHELTMEEAEALDSYYVYLEKTETDDPVMDPWWILHAEAKRGGYSDLSFEEVEAFYFKMKELRSGK